MSMPNLSWSHIRGCFEEKRLGFAVLILLASIGILQYIYSLSYAIALRRALLVIAFAVSLKYFLDAMRNNPGTLRLLFWIFFLLQIWMLVISGFAASNPTASLIEWKGQWLPPFLSFIIGVGVAQALSQTRLQEPSSTALLSILVPIFVYVFVNDIVIVWTWIKAGTFVPNLGGIGDHHGVSGYVILLIFPILIADLLGRALGVKQLVPASTQIVCLLLVVLTGSLSATTNRNGLIAAMGTSILGMLLVYGELQAKYSKKQRAIAAMLVLITLTGIGSVVYKFDSRWHNIFETVQIAWDIDRDLLWLNADNPELLPVTAAGEKVDFSGYNRIAWAREGMRVLGDHPWGTELSRGIFRRLTVEKYGHGGMAHSHNGWIDLGLQVGFPGLLLWAVFLILLARAGWKLWRANQNPLGLALAIMVIMFGLRGLQDSIFRDHELEQFLLVSSLLFWSGVLSSRNQSKQTVR